MKKKKIWIESQLWLILMMQTCVTAIMLLFVLRLEKIRLKCKRKKVVRRQKRDRFVFQQLEMLLIFHFSMKFWSGHWFDELPVHINLIVHISWSTRCWRRTLRYSFAIHHSSSLGIFKSSPDFRGSWYPRRNPKKSIRRALSNLKLSVFRKWY